MLERSVWICNCPEHLHWRRLPFRSPVCVADDDFCTPLILLHSHSLSLLSPVCVANDYFSHCLALDDTSPLCSAHNSTLTLYLHFLSPCIHMHAYFVLPFWCLANSDLLFSTLGWRQMNVAHVTGFVQNAGAASQNVAIIALRDTFHKLDFAVYWPRNIFAVQYIAKIAAWGYISQIGPTHLFLSAAEYCSACRLGC